MRRLLVARTAVFAALFVPLLMSSARASAVNHAAHPRLKDGAQQQATTLAIPAGQARFTVRRLEGDVTADCMVNIDDDQQVAAHYPFAAGNPAYAAGDDINLPQPDGAIDIADLQFVVGRKGSSCAAPVPAQLAISLAVGSSTAAVTLAPDPPTANVWLCTPGQGDCGQTVPSSLNPQDWQNGIVMDQLMTISTPGLDIVGYQFELRYDAARFQPPVINDLGVLNDGGLRATICSQANSQRGDIVFHCSSTGPDGIAASWSGPRSVARVTFTLQPGVPDAVRPTSGNGQASDVLSTNASATTVAQSNPAPSVGGIAEQPDVATLPSAAEASGHDFGAYVLGALLTFAIVVAVAAGWRSSRTPRTRN